MKRRSVYSVAGLLFVVSGALGLIYQIVWFKYLSFFLGNTLYAQTIVVATFMGGLAIGAKLWGGRADIVQNRLALYGWLEVAVGLYCFVYPYFLELLKGLFVSLVLISHLPTDGSGVLFLKFLTSILSLLPPTILMGGTLPVLVRFISERLEDSGRNVAILYFLNSFGAVVGSILGGFFLVALLGLSTTIYATASLNIAVGLSALVLGRTRIGDSEVESEIRAEFSHEFSSSEQNIALLVAGLSGFAAMIYEIGWVRLFIPVLGSSTYSFTLMLVGFISGITLGSIAVSSAVQRIKNLFGFLSFCQFGIVLSMFGVLLFYGRVPYYFWVVAHMLNRTETTYPLFLSIEFIFGFLMMILPTFFLGMSLPVASRVASGNIQRLGRTVGNVFSVNTAGTVIGTLCAGFFMIPALGVRRSIEVGVVVNLVLGLLVLIADRKYSKNRKYVSFALILAATGMYFVFQPDWSRGVELSGVFRQINHNTAPPISYKNFLAMDMDRIVVYYKEGATATVAVVESETPDGRQNVLYINGKADASSIGDLPTQVLLGQLPSLLHSHPQSALVVGLGSGVTLGSILTHPVKHVDCVEISPEVVEAERFFENVNNRPLADTRTRLTIEDGMAFLHLTSVCYDFIVSEPSNPWIAGIGSLYTVQFFDEAKNHLNEGGIFAQWFHLYEMDDETLRLVIRTFRNSFKHVSLWYSLSADIILVGSDQPLQFDYSKLNQRMLENRIHDDLSRIRINYPTTLLSLQALATDDIAEYSGTGPLNTVDHPYLEYWAPRTFFTNHGVKELRKYDERLDTVRESLFLKKYLRTRALTDGQLLDIGTLHSEGQRGYQPLGYSILSAYCRHNPMNLEAMDKLADVSQRLGYVEEALQYRKKLIEKSPNLPRYLEKYAWLKFSHEHNTSNGIIGINADESVSLMKKCISLSSDTVDRYRVMLADIYYSLQDYRKAADNYAKALQIRESHEPDMRVTQDALLVQLAQSLFHLGIRSSAAGYALQATRINPNNEEARDLIYTVWTGETKMTIDTSEQSNN